MVSSPDDHLLQLFSLVIFVGLKTNLSALIHSLFPLCFGSKLDPLHASNTGHRDLAREGVDGEEDVDVIVVEDLIDVLLHVLDVHVGVQGESLDENEGSLQTAGVLWYKTGNGITAP
jgi:hypothetical protein